MSIGNPMGLNGPNWTGNTAQSDYRVPANPQPTPYPVGWNVMNLTWPIPKHTPTDDIGRTLPQIPTVFYPTNLDAIHVSNPGHG
jgi:hypothetical protein